MSDRKLDVTVIDRGGEPVENASVWLYEAGKGAARDKTNARGTVELDLTDKSAWPAGSYTLRVLPPGQPLAEEKSVALGEEGPPEPVLVTVAAKADIDGSTGGNLLAVLILMLVLGFVGYLALHGVTVDKLRRGETIGKTVDGALSASLTSMLDTAADHARAAQRIVAAAEAAREESETEGAEHDAAAADEGGDDAAGDATDDEAPASEEPENKGAPVEGEEVEGDADAGKEAEGADAEEEEQGEDAGTLGKQALADTRVAASLSSARKIFDSVKEAQVGLLDPTTALAVDELFDQAEGFTEAGDVEALIEAIGRLRTQTMPRRTAFLWTETPGRLFEVFFWALIATLLRLIFNTGYYLYKGCFLASAIPHHISLLVTIPVVAVIITFVLSLVEVSIKLGETAINLDMANVLISVVVAAMIGLAPWKSWDFLRDLADALFEKLGSWFGSDGDSAAAS